MKLLNYCNKTIEYSFYALFFFVPLVFSGDTSELFELNKMWLTFGLTIIIGTAWAAKMVLEKKIVVQRTPIDILLLLFLASQIISSIFSLDSHVSWWGYYSRFNGGLLSTICYILLYYAFVTNLKVKHVMKTLFVSLLTGLAVSIWGFPSHFGADPTCLVFRGNFDTSCWTYAFQPTIRAFSTLGQPAWLAAYMAFLLPISMAYTLKNKKSQGKSISYLLLTILMYLLLIYSDTRAGFIAFWVANILFWAAVYFKKLYPKQYFFRMLVIINVLFVLSNFIFGVTFYQLNKFTLPELIKTSAPAPQQPAATQQSKSAAPAASSGLDDGITNSGNIRLLVWQGAIKAWQNNPFFGTGVETYAFAYYKYKLPAHNLTSEWDYLYNKAHNEYLNYLATTGLFGLGTYLGFIGVFFFVAFKYIKSHWSAGSEHHTAAYNAHADKTIENSPATLHVLLFALLAGYITILISNFFGFSVVIINLYTFLVPGFVFILLGLLKENHQVVLPASAAGELVKHDGEVGTYQWTAILLFIVIACWMIFGLIWYRQADIAYALGNNLDKVGDYRQAYPQLTSAVQMVPHEPVYEDELSINLAALSAMLYSQPSTITQAAEVAKNAIALSDDVVAHHPNNVVYWKDRVRLFYTLSVSDKTNAGMYLQYALQAIDTARSLAPTDAKIAYNQGVLHGQAGDLQQGIQILNETVKLKPDYIDAYVALGLFYHEAAVDKKGRVINPGLQQKAVDTYTYILQNLDPNNVEVKKNLEQWRISQ